MKNEIQVFSHSKFGSVRRIVIDDVPWLVGKDVATALGYSNPQKALRDHVDEEDKTVNELFTVNGTQGILINESGVYSLIFTSKLKEAKEFKHWVTAEVLPTINKYGLYVAERVLNDPDFLISALTALKEERAKNKELKERNTELTDKVFVQNAKIAEMQPKVRYYNLVLNCRDLVPISVIAKDYGWSAVHMNNYLKQRKVQYKQGRVWLLYQKYATSGYTSSRTVQYPGNDGKTHSAVHTYWTQKGRMFLYELLKEDNIFPLIEQETLEKEALEAVMAKTETA